MSEIESFETRIRPIIRKQLAEFIAEVLKSKTFTDDYVFGGVCMQVITYIEKEEASALKLVFGWNSTSELTSWSEERNLPTSTQVRELLLKEVKLLIKL